MYSGQPDHYGWSCMHASDIVCIAICFAVLPGMLLHAALFMVEVTVSACNATWQNYCVTCLHVSLSQVTQWEQAVCKLEIKMKADSPDTIYCAVFCYAAIYCVVYCCAV